MPQQMQLLTCHRCRATWAREPTKGRRPRLCPDCASVGVIPHQRSEDEPRDRRHVRLDENSLGYQLLAKHTTYLNAMVLAYRAIRARDYALAEETLAAVIPDGRL